jgi:DNA-binding GntR family transcriptional regulator
MTPQTDESPLVDDIAARIRARIMNGELAIGKPLRQAALATEFGVSRTPVREALRQLQNGGLIEMQPNRGAVVRVPAPGRCARRTRCGPSWRAWPPGAPPPASPNAGSPRCASTTPSCARPWRGPPARAGGGSLTTTAANDCFHTVICEAADNPWLTRMIDRINESFPRNVSSLALAGDERHRQLNIRQHEAVIEALAAHDADRADALMREHVISSGEHLTAWYERRSQTVFHG